MPSEIDQAAERLRMFATSTTLAERCIIYALDNPSGDYVKIRTSGRIDELVRRDRKTLADAYLAGQRGERELAPLNWEEIDQGHWRAITALGTFCVNEGGLCWWSVGAGFQKPITSVEDGKQQVLEYIKHRVAGLYVGGTQS